MKRQGFTNLARALLLASTALLPHSAAMAAEVNAWYGQTPKSWSLW